MQSRINEKKSLQRLLNIIGELREKCPWDKKQTYQSLRYLTIEETYELSQAIISDNFDDIKEELGDLLLHILFYAKIFSEKDMFNITDIMNSLCDKLIRRHPHIYGSLKVKNETEVIQNWEKIKLKEKKDISVLSGIPDHIPTILKSIRIYEKIKGVGVDLGNKDSSIYNNKDIITKISKLKFNKLNETDIGEILFYIITNSKKSDINPIDSLDKFNLEIKNKYKNKKITNS
ncbi:MAG: nucleoside triphosphate pyrophosphohydrolase [Flavobacteriales bacterium]|nr:nucleoside triphosphate pyrophosphohydrolase [Flavobacteriales bacterium]